MITLPLLWQRRLSSPTIIYILAACISILLSVYINVRETVINPDAICYLVSAESIVGGGMKASNVCPQAVWPFYSFIIAHLAQLFHVSYQAAAFACNGLCTLISVLSFLAIIHTLGATQRVLWLAAAVILLSHQFNYVRQYIVRDHGFWSFYLLSMLSMLRYVSAKTLANQVAYALLWVMSIGIATLFRIEGAIFMMVLPFAAFFLVDRAWSNRFKAYALLHALPLLAGLLAASWLMIHPEKISIKLDRIYEVGTQLRGGWQMMLAQYHTIHQALIQHVLPIEAVRDTSLILILMLGLWYFINIINNLSWIYSVLVGYAWWNRVAKFSGPATVVVTVYILINFCITFGFFIERLFLAKRYLIALSLSLMIYVPYALDHLYTHSYSYKHKLSLYMAVLFITIAGIAGILDFGYSKTYVRQAADWLSANVPAKSKLYINDLQLMYYTNRERYHMWQILSKPRGNVQQYDYVALRVKHNDPQTSLTQPVAATFANSRGDKVVIYKVKH